MVKAYHMVVLFLMAGLLGCSPVDESVIKKASFSGEASAATRLGTGKTLGEGSMVDLDPEIRAFLQIHGGAIRREAASYGIDWRLVLAIVKQESRFAEKAVSEKGAAGLMQLMPRTGEEVATQLSLQNLNRPEHNIKGGVHYFRKLYNLFEGVEEPDRTKLALAAYNAGLGRVYDAQQVAEYLNEDPSTWKSVAEAFPLLSKRYYTLHRNIWPQEKPRSGWFGDSRETVAYVDKVIRNYEDLRLALN
jgi:membrane-bound lytic murein transglycosylase F